MKLNEKRIVEYVLLVLFPAAIFAGCAGNGNEKPQTLTEDQANETQIEQVSYAVETIDENESVESMVINSNDNKSIDVTITPTQQIAAKDTQAESMGHIVYFGTDQYTLRAEDESLLGQYASKLLSDPKAYLIINGHADERGTEDHNLRLSKQRAREVEGRLLSLGVSDSQLRIKSYGETTPVESASNWQENRRVELEYTDSKESSKVTHEDSNQTAEGLEAGPMLSQVE